MPPQRSRDPRKQRPSAPGDADDGVVGLRIIGGKHRGRPLAYSGDPRTRPMKDRVRESLFNLLGTRCSGKYAIDLFAGTGALGLEAISRGAVGATLLERHYPTCKWIEQNVRQLELQAVARVSFGDAFLWARKPNVPQTTPWVVFCSPPYDFYVERRDDVLALLGSLFAAAPAESVFVVESDERFDFAGLPLPDRWNIRDYPPARVGLLDKPASE
jgi:16S rRNA (guanine966-N2)-methyltransferase